MQFGGFGQGGFSLAKSAPLGSAAANPAEGSVVAGAAGAAGDDDNGYAPEEESQREFEVSKYTLNAATFVS